MEPETERIQLIKSPSRPLTAFDSLLKHNSFLCKLGTFQQSLNLGSTKRLDQTVHMTCTAVHFDPFWPGLHEGFVRRRGGLLEDIVEHLVEHNIYQLEHGDMVRTNVRSLG